MNAHWVLESQAQSVEFAYILAAIRSSNAAAIETYLSRDKVTAYATSDVNAVNQYELSDINIPDNSIAVISVQGMLYSWKTFEIERFIQKAISHPNIVGIVLFVNTPGGMVHRVDLASVLIKNSPKPINAFVTGACCSGGMWLVSGCTQIKAASVLDTFGSVGVMTNYFSFKKYWKEMGIVDEDIYATHSTKKNYETREIEKPKEGKEPNYDPLIKRLDFTNDLFQKTISTNLNIPLDLTSDVFQGAIFNAEEAIQSKLVHSIGSFEDLLRDTLAAGLLVKSKQY